MSDHRSYWREWARRNRESQRAATARYVAKVGYRDHRTPEQLRYTKNVNNALRRHRLERPKRCPLCGSKPERPSMIYARFPGGDGRAPLDLDAIYWRCSECAGKERWV